MIAEECKRKHRHSALLHLLFDYKTVRVVRINRVVESARAMAAFTTKHSEDERIMQSYLQSASPLRTAQSHPRSRPDVTYQVITIAAMLLVLATVWVF
jgi:hypothetical protein